MITLHGPLQGICSIAATGETTAGRIPRVFDVTIDDLGKRQFYERRTAAGAAGAHRAMDTDRRRRLALRLDGWFGGFLMPPM